ncbi:glycosyltransferase family 4 protein [Anaerococcus tetradius]|uniref:Glycosyltransferase, group 1 family protein n=1 Tax=Anaerococcus tetradius TaxID=33036 RepID=A0A133KER3_9FIRM|nr:glycosyltransferase family 4 protein [Anaerococcus tetradius]KWZ78069.1 glycosyltransferase, group 1 family protein [Anaerococcus tetradius]
MKILILSQGYPNNNGDVSLMYIHTRNIEYIKNGLSVDVLNFETEKCYKKDGINVISERYYKENNKNYDLLIVHAANIKNHYRFLQKYEYRFRKIMFFYHGHEVLRLTKDYPKPYKFKRDNNFIVKKIINIYDSIKLLIWRNYLPKIAYKSYFIFVSEWMKNEFYVNTKIDNKNIKAKSTVIYNCVGSEFENGIYNVNSEKKYDFITIRSNFDGSKYCIDIVNKLAKNTPEAKFLLVGNGDFFNNYHKSENIEVLNKNLTHEEIVRYLDNSKFALMPTRYDAQGLMMCEMTAYGIPTITSNIDISNEIFRNTSNVFFIDNDKTSNLNKFLNLRCSHTKNERFFKKNTVYKEIDLIKSICN